MRKKLDRSFKFICLSVTLISMSLLFVLIYQIGKEGLIWLDWDFLNNFPSRTPEKAGIKAAIAGSLWIISFTALIAVPLGVATAIYLEDYAPRNKFFAYARLNIANLAGIPSIVYGLLGLAIFVRFLGFERSILAGACTLALLILPVIIIASQEAIKAVPKSIREAAYAVGARKWQVVFGQVLPASIPGIMTGVILAISRAIGETAPLIIVGALTYIAFTPEGPLDSFTVLPIQIYNWAARPSEEFHQLAASGIIVLLFILFVLNAIAVFIRHKYQRFKS